MCPSFTAGEIAKLVDGVVSGDASVKLAGFSAANAAKPGDLTFAENEKYFAAADASAATAVLVDRQCDSRSGKVIIRVRQARVAFARILPLFCPPPVFEAGVHPSSVVAPDAKIDATAHIGPFCVIGRNVRIGPKCVLRGANHLGDEAVLGEAVELFPHVTLYARTQIGNRVIIHAGSVIGSDGFGYVLDGGEHVKIPHVGNVIIHDDVEIGANVTIDRGALGPTLIHRGVKIDNLVQIGHNVEVGEHSVLVAQVGIAGSTKLGRFAVLGGQVGIAGHLRLGDQIQVAAKSGVMHSIPNGEKWWGSPARPDRLYKRQIIASQQLPELLRRVRAIESRLGIDKPPKSTE